MVMYEITDLHFRYPGSERLVLNGINLQLNPGEILSVLGPNGAGKSTLLACMLGLLKPVKGTILLNGRRLPAMNPAEIAKLVSYVPQASQPSFGYSAFSYVLMGRTPLISTFRKPSKKDQRAAWEAMEKMKLTHLADAPCTEISGGEQQQVMIARAIVRKPRVILFDEPTAHLDYGNQIRTLRMIKELSADGYTIMITTHTPDYAILLGGKAAILDRQGHLIYGNTPQIITEDMLRTIYGEEVIIRWSSELNRQICLLPNL